MATAASPSEEECTCPVCCDIFKDPVLLLCGHSFCKYCLQEWWRQSKLQTCPVCKEVFRMASQPPRNLALRNLSDRLRQEKSQGANSGDVCHLHSEKLKLFCENDQQLICVICRDSQKHKKHNCVPVNEAAEAQRTKIKVGLLHLKRKLGMFKNEKLVCESMAGHIKVQAQQTEKAIKEDFQQLYQFLQAEEAARLAAVKREAKLKSEAMNIRVVNLTTEISSLTCKVQSIQREIMADDISLMLNVKSTEQQSQCNLPEPTTPSGALIDEARHLGNLQFRVWTKMKEIIQYTPVTLDPNTTTSQLTEHMTRSTDQYLNLPCIGNPERTIGSFVDVLGTEGFTSGKHSWDVEVGNSWGAGVAAKIKDQTALNIWSIYMCPCTGSLVERAETHKILNIKDNLPEKVRVELDYDCGLLSFYDLDRKKTVHTIKCTFTGMVFPFFTWDVKILPAELSVRIKQPK